MVMAVNNAPLQTQTYDYSGIVKQAKQGYKDRQQQKAMSEMMAVSDFNERLQLARQHKNAGMLVPALQKHEEARQKAALDNLTASADIHKTYSETGKLNAETGKIGSETTGQEAENAFNVNKGIANAAMSKNPNLFNKLVGEYHKRGLINKDQVVNWVRAFKSGDTNAMQQLAMTDIDYAKNTNDNQVKRDTNLFDNETSRINASGNNQTSIEVAGIKGQYGIETADLNNRSRENINHTNNQAKYTAEAQKAEIASNKGEVMQGSDGMSYVFYPSTGKVEKLLDENEQHFQGVGKANNTSSRGSSGTAKPLTESQSKNKLFGERMQSAVDIIDELEGKGVTRGSLLNSAGFETTANLYGGLIFDGIVGNSPKQQQYIQAQRNFINAVLRKESGAVIGEDEFDNAKKQYFPQVGDDKTVIAQKMANRRNATKLILEGAGAVPDINDSSNRIEMKVGKKSVYISDLME